MNRIEKPLTQYFNEHYREEFRSIVSDNIPQDDMPLKETVMMLIEKSYNEGFCDGAGLILWSKD